MLTVDPDVLVNIDQIARAALAADSRTARSVVEKRTAESEAQSRSGRSQYSVASASTLAGKVDHLSGRFATRDYPTA